ncbi:4538_t:CDS:2 [Entrophospora sp. SA101]|nr:15341_t:CDS:2 [Entrophospora sp. SA101]CAJ0907847.1 4538_t:CDS:2 [Entrophospora sp. SA101]
MEIVELEKRLKENTSGGEYDSKKNAPSPPKKEYIREMNSSLKMSTEEIRALLPSGIDIMPYSLFCLFFTVDILDIIV